MFKEKAEVVILGGGLSGLVAAKVLADAGVDFQVLEASARFGGRIESARDVNDKPVIDLGPSWVWPEYQTSIGQWFEHLDIGLFDQYETGNAVIDFDVSATQQQPLPGQHGIMRPIGGPQAIVDRLCSLLPSERMHLNSAVTKLEDLSGQVRVSLADGRSIIAKQVILCVPLRVAAQSIETTGVLDERIQRQMSATPTWMATQAKFGVSYSTPFWRDAGLSGRIASRLGPLVEGHDISPKDGEIGVLFGFVGIPHEVRAQHEDKLMRAICDQLDRCFGPEALNYSEIILKDWAKEPFICSALDLSSPPNHPERVSDDLRKPHKIMGSMGVIHFGVAETADTDPGLIAGALQAAERAAKAAIDHVAGS